ncbi:MAG: type I restriction endonuclease subunit R [Cryobacterium sp.]|nr:type I restriction endonuclease subunit R [Cryobacterium sp.]
MTKSNNQSSAQSSQFEPIVVSTESTVVAEHDRRATTPTAHQSEAELEKEFIRQLGEQAYEYLDIHTEADLIDNLRKQIEALNSVNLSDAEWQRLLGEYITRANDGIVEKTVRVQKDSVHAFKRDDGTTKNISLFDKSNIHNNRLQVINQYEVAKADGAKQSNRYDVTILVNGLPMVHIELKRRGVQLREAFNQINRYQRESFWSGSGLFGYVQIFVISNGTLSKYYSNTTRLQHLEDSTGKKSVRRTSNSWEFTSWWADETNEPIQDLTGFTKTFFAKHTLLAILARYCVLTVDHMLLVMRPYQIVATEKMLRKIAISTNHRQLGTLDAGGYIWHTTGSGKTLTSFKAAQLAARLPGVDKVVFVVDRRDLDWQTQREYDRLEEGAASATTSTNKLSKHLADPERRVLITTIQKLARLVQSEKGHAIYDGHVVLIFDECHRSQFGEMHTDITKAFKRYNLFGFTGTPIFAANASSGGNPQLKTTEQAFGEMLHSYTIVNAIDDKNVLPFRVDFVNTLKSPEQLADKQVSAIDTERALLDSERIRLVVDYILEHFNQKTRRNDYYSVGERRLNGFNSLFATASIVAARAYYNAFKVAQEKIPAGRRLKVGIIYSFATNEALGDGYLDEESFETAGLDDSSREFLEGAIADYNETFGTEWSTTSDGFAGYYNDLSKRLKQREIDLVIVVNMFLTGFDATTLNTLWVDKNLRLHGLIQAFSRTNRILNSVKTYGNIVTFRNLEQETNDAIALFGNPEARGIVLLKPYAEYFEEYSKKVAELTEKYDPGTPIVGEAAQKEFVNLFGLILRLENILVSFDEFDGNELLTEGEREDYRSRYLDLYAEFRNLNSVDKERINDDLVFEIELIKQVEVNVDYILMLVEKYRAERGNGEDKEIRARISRAVDASPTLRSKKDLIEEFVERVTATGDIDQEWSAHIAARRESELERIIEEERLDPDAARAYMDRAFRDGALQSSGTALTEILPPTPRFTSDGAHSEIRQRVLDRLTAFFERFFGLGSGD